MILAAVAETPESGGTLTVAMSCQGYDYTTVAVLFTPRSRRVTSVRDVDGEDVWTSEWTYPIPEPVGTYVIGPDSGEGVHEAVAALGHSLPYSVAWTDHVADVPVPHLFFPMPNPE